MLDLPYLITRSIYEVDFEPRCHNHVLAHAEQVVNAECRFETSLALPLRVILDDLAVEHSCKDATLGRFQDFTPLTQSRSTYLLSEGVPPLDDNLLLLANSDVEGFAGDYEVTVSKEG